MNLAEAVVLALSAAVAGAINAVAGGGSLISFPAAVAVGMSPLVANATNAVALTPGSIASAYGYRRELAQDRDILRLFLPASALGGAIGSVLLLVTPQRLFDAIVPVLVLFATALLLHQNLRKKKPEGGGEAPAWELSKRPGLEVGLQLLVGVYGGYFGAGMGIMMLAILSRVGGAHIHRMNGVKSVLGATINAIAAVAFVIAKAIDYRAAGVMAVGAVIGGLLGAEGARRVKPQTVRWGVVAIGFVLSAALAYRRFLT